MIVNAIRGLSDNSLKLTDQPDEGITYAKKITKNEQKILFNKSLLSSSGRPTICFV